MNQHPFALIDTDRARLFSLIPHARSLWQESKPWIDRDGIAWLCGTEGGVGIAITWLGPGWVCDDQAQAERADELRACKAKMSLAATQDHEGEFARLQAQFRLGQHAERLLWAIHAAVLRERTALLHLSDAYLARCAWAGAKRPRHWRLVLDTVLRNLSWIHCFSAIDGVPALGTDTVLITHFGDVRGSDEDACPPNCPDRHGARHHHFQIEIGRGFLGCLEQFARPGEDGVRTYLFPIQGKRKSGPTLRTVGKTGQLVTAYLPAVLGARSAVNSLSVAQRRLFTALVREQTRASRNERLSPFDAEVIHGGLVPGFASREKVGCPYLVPTVDWVGFNGNGRVRKGQGYKLSTWLGKAGYAADRLPGFLEDAKQLARLLEIKVVGLNRQHWFSLDDLATMSLTGGGCRNLESIHLRFYANTDYLGRWNTFFHWDNAPAGHVAPVACCKTIEDLTRILNRKSISMRALARGLGKNHSFIVRLLSEAKPWPAGLLDRAITWAETQGESAKGGRDAVEEPDCRRLWLEIALEYRLDGLSIVPQLPGAKKPCVRWKEFQSRRPHEEELIDWFDRWPEAGLALILGPVSKILVVDVDGPEAHEALIERLGREPLAPKAISGSRKPFRYHLYFRHPNFATKAKSTPWHPKLEFRGKGGIVIIPPSLHKSGQRYAWARKKSLDDMAIPDLPGDILEALRPLPPAKWAPRPGAQSIPANLDVSRTTKEFLSGKWANGPGWNDRLFRAACDLAGRDIAIEKAEPLLLAGAAPWNSGEEEVARRTIQSAYSQPREPARW